MQNFYGLLNLCCLIREQVLMSVLNYLLYLFSYPRLFVPYVLLCATCLVPYMLLFLTCLVH